MGEEPPASLSFEDGYLRVAGACGRAEYLERLAHSHALGKLPMSGLPNGKGERRFIPSIMSTDYRLAFGTGGRGAMAVRKDIAARWLPGVADVSPAPRRNQWPLSFRRACDLDWRFPPLSTAAPQPRRLLLAESDTEIDERAHRVIMRVCATPKPGDAPAAFTGLQLSWKEFVKLFHKGSGTAPADARALTAAAAREILRKAIAENPSLSQSAAVALIKSIDPQFDREEVRKIMRELTDNRPRGRPNKN